MSATQRELLEERWGILMRDVVRFKDEARISTVNSKRQSRIDDVLDELAGMLVDEVHDDELDPLEAVKGDIWDEIRERLLKWAETTEKRRAEYRASIEPYMLKPDERTAAAPN